MTQEARRRRPVQQRSDPQATGVMTNADSRPPSAAAVFFFSCLFTILSVVFVLLASSFVSLALTDSYTWGYQVEELKQLPVVSLLFPPIIFTAEELAKYDGTDPNNPIYLSVRGHVFDVTKGARFYGPKGGYHIFAGRDISRSFATGCFDPDVNSPKQCIQAAETGLEGLNANEVEEVDKWIDFYTESKDYHLVGYYPTSPSANEEAKKWL